MVGISTPSLIDTYYALYGSIANKCEKSQHNVLALFTYGKTVQNI